MGSAVAVMDVPAGTGIAIFTTLRLIDGLAAIWPYGAMRPEK